MDGAFDTYWQAPHISQAQIDHISEALHATLNVHIPNQVRQQALQHLEAVKSRPDAPFCGFTLADDWDQNDTIRYYGLQLLEFSVRYRWSEYNAEQTGQIRTWVKQLAGSLRSQDAGFIRNKVGQLWVEVAKRSWAEEWMDMDKQLVNLWERPMETKGVTDKLLVLYILETLSEDIINNEDTMAGLRTDILGYALNEVMIPPGLYQEHLQNRGKGEELRCGEEGWLNRACSFFSMCVKQARMGGSPELVQSMETCAIKALNMLRATIKWISLKAADEISCIDCLFLPFHTANVTLQIASMEVLHALLNRQYNPHFHTAWKSLFLQALKPDRIAMIRQAFEQNYTSPGEDEEKYTLLKKMSEVLSVLADAVAAHSEFVDQTLDLPAFFDLLLLVAQSKSLIVSIPVLHSWTRQMNFSEERQNNHILNALGTLLETCSERLLRYEALAEDTNNDIIQFLNEDFDTTPERHAFLGNYRRYCTSIIQSIAHTRPLDALSHVLDQMRLMLQEGPYTGARGFDSATFSKTSLPVLKFDAQYNVVSSALKGYSAWVGDVMELTPEDPSHDQAQKDLQQASNSLQQWCHGMSNIHTDDPAVAEQVLQTFVLVLRTLESPSPSFVLSVVQHLLTMRLYENPAHIAFSDAVKMFEGLRVVELQKLAMAFPNDLLEVYHELEPRIGVLTQKHSNDPRLVWGFKAFLFMIVHRASGIDHDTRMSRLQQMLNPIYEAWMDQKLSVSVQSLANFCESIGLGNIGEFYTAHGFDRVSDWSAQQLNESGQARQTEVQEKSGQLPLRMTKAMLAATTEKLKIGTTEYTNAAALWGNLLPVVLPKLLEMIRHAQAFNGQRNWAHLPNGMQVVVKRTLQDRFWQSGISNESKDEFYARISGSKTSYEGFASTVRGTMRNVREQGYHILYLMTKFEEQFYGLTDLAEPLAEALFHDAINLSAHHLHPIINLTTGIVQRCPAQQRAKFLPPVLKKFFAALDRKISTEWEALEKTAELDQRGDDELGDEMRTESVLRQLTHSMVSFVPFLLEFDKPTATSHSNGYDIASEPPKPTLSELVLTDPTLLEPMILFCTRALRMRDTRCCITICKVFRNIIPMFAAPTGSSSTSPDAINQVREFISTEVLKACITSLNEPYFADTQKDLAALIAQIIVLYAPMTDTPRDILLSLPDMNPTKVDRVIAKVCKTQNDRQKRSLVLELLDTVRGVSIYEVGKIDRKVEKPKRSTATQYMEVEQRPVNVNGDVDGLDGMVELFGGA